MDADRFDTLARRLVIPTTRRASLGAAAAGGLLSALGLSRAAPAAKAAQGGRCVLAFVATVRQGPSVEQVLTPNGVRPGEVRGELSFLLSETGKLEEAVLSLPDGARFPVVGQATGHALQVRIEVAPRVALVAVGVGEKEVAACQGAIDGVATGPEVGDLGDWHAAVLRQTEGRGETEAAASAAPGTPAKTPAPTGRTGPAAPASNAGATGETAAGSLRTGAAGAAGSPSSAPTPTPAVGGMADLPPPSGPTGSAAPTGPTGSTGATGATAPSEPSGPSGPVTESAQCASGLSLCNGVCVDLVSDPANCGECGYACKAGQVCAQGGTCVDTLVCPAGLTNCDGVCVDLQNDLTNCGWCDNHCIYAGTGCLGGMCVCSDGLPPCHGVCVNYSSDNAHCGACDKACTVDQSCQDGVCQQKIDKGGNTDMLCDAGLTLCNKECADVQSNPAHCGGCDSPCGSDQICQGGVCNWLAAESGSEPVLLDCTAIGLSPCGDLCVNLASDRANCGSCGNVCTETETCLSGSCGGIADQQPDVLLSCAALGLADCGGGVCVDLNTDHNNCGACGNACYPGLCANGNGTCTVCTDDVVAAGYCAANP